MRYHEPIPFEFPLHRGEQAVVADCGRDAIVLAMIRICKIGIIISGSDGNLSLLPAFEDCDNLREDRGKENDSNDDRKLGFVGKIASSSIVHSHDDGDGDKS